VLLSLLDGIWLDDELELLGGVEELDEELGVWAPATTAPMASAAVAMDNRCFFTCVLLEKSGQGDAFMRQPAPALGAHRFRVSALSGSRCRNSDTLGACVSRP